MSHIFISYKRVDKDKVFKIKDQIESALGEKCWIDLDGIESDDAFVEKIITAIDACEVFLFMYSAQHADIKDYQKDWTVRELQYAEREGKRIVFVNIDGSDLSKWFSFMFGAKQQVDGTSDNALCKLFEDLEGWLFPERVAERERKREEAEKEVLRKLKEEEDERIRKEAEERARIEAAEKARKEVEEKAKEETRAKAEAERKERERQRRREAADARKREEKESWEEHNRIMQKIAREERRKENREKIIRTTLNAICYPFAKIYKLFTELFCTIWKYLKAIFTGISTEDGAGLICMLRHICLLLSTLISIY